MTRSQTASGVSPAGEKSSLMPATFARPSMRSPAAAMTASIASCFVRSPATVTMSASGSSALRASSFSAAMSLAITRPPSRAMREAVALPMPEAAPVTITVLPAKRPEVSFSFQPSDSSSSGISPPLAAAHQVVDDRLGELALAHRDELLQGQASTGGEEFGVGAGLLEECADEGPAVGSFIQSPMVECAVRAMLFLLVRVSQAVRLLIFQCTPEYARKVPRPRSEKARQSVLEAMRRALAADGTRP